MQMIDQVEPDERGKEPPVGLGQAVAHQIAGFAQAILQPVQGTEERYDGAVIGFLCRGEAALVDAVVERVVDAVVDGRDGLAQVLGPEIRIVASDMVEGAVEHTDDFRTFV